jgi:acyl dehydratase
VTADRAGYGVLSDESFARSRRRIGIPLRISPAHITEVNADATRHFAYGYGDDNPLYCDPGYGKNTRWGGLIAPPNFTYCMGENAAPPPTPEQKQELKGDPFAGLGSYQAAMEFEYYRPLRAGDHCQVIRAQVGVEDKPSRFGGRTAHVTHDFLYANGEGQVVTIQRGTWINAERHTSRERSGQKPPLTFDPYTDEQLAEIDALYDTETRRGSETRYFEDVEIGAEIQPRVKGPLVVTDLIVWHLGWGMQLTPPGTFGIARKVRK